MPAMVAAVDDLLLELAIASTKSRTATLPASEW